MNQRNIEIFKDTLRQAQEKYPVSVKENAVYYNVNNIPCVEMKSGDTPITMVHGGTVSTGYANAENMRVAILNFADALVPGGLVWEGVNTQEENICRCSNLYPLINAEESDAEYYAPNASEVSRTRKDVYTDNVIYAKDITVFKDDITYENIEPRKMDVITCPSPSAYMFDYEALPVYLKRIERIVKSAVINDANCIVLGAWGCGAFAQDPKVVARAFAVVLNNYNGYFKKIIFAIRPTHGNGVDMYEIFKRTLTEIYGNEVIDEK